ncbi:MAG: NYN domain-containing protein, partial [Actinomycetota bacterium]|nr:NYN domain-containing protein [Actinomycetota bacterium]
MDRCALFVDAGYVLADGAMAVHGTPRGESVSWDYEGLLQLLSSLARERSGLPLLRCYWYEATVEGRRTAEQDALADIPGVKLRVAKIRPGRREGVETEIHRDLTTLARNNAISDALVISAEEDLAQVIADVQDLGLRVTLVHIAVDGNWTISRALRQESDDILEIGGEQLRPYVELIAGAEPVHTDEAEGADHVAARPLANGHSTAGATSYQPMPASANHAPPAIYTAPVVAEYQRPVLQLPRAATRDDRPRDDRARDDRTRDDRPREDRARDDRPREDRTRED